MIALVITGDWALRLAALAAWLFVVHWALTAPFWRAPEGWLLMSLFTLLGVVFGYFALAASSRRSIAAFVTSPYLAYVRLGIGVAFLAISVAFVCLRAIRHRQGLELKLHAITPQPPAPPQ